MSENVLPIFSSRSCMMSCLILRYLNHFELIIIYRWGNVLISLIYMFFGRTDAKAETPILWLPHAKSWLIGKVSDAGRDWGQEEKGTTENEMAGWHHWLNGHEFGSFVMKWDQIDSCHSLASLGAQPWRIHLPMQEPQEPRDVGFHPWLGMIPLEKSLVTHSSIPAWRIHWRATQSIGSQRVRHDWRDSADRQVILLLKILDDYHLNLEQSSKSWAWVS